MKHKRYPTHWRNSEDDMVITAEGCEVLTEAAPKTVAAIEELMNLHLS